mgnify:CR=1 FL=1
MNILFFLTPKQDVAFLYDDFTLRQALEKMEYHRYSSIPMLNRKGEEFSSFVKLDMNTGRPQYSRTPDGFSERQVPVVPAEVYGHVFTAQERANLQDGKTILVSDLKSANNKTFSSYLKVNANSGQLQYFQENPDIRRNTARRAAQVDDTQNRQQEQKKGSRQAV